MISPLEQFILLIHFFKIWKMDKWSATFDAIFTVLKSNQNRQDFSLFQHIERNKLSQTKSFSNQS